MIDSTKVTKNWPALPALPSLTNRSLLLKRVGNLKSGQCKTILDWLSEHAELGFESIGESPQIGSDWALCLPAECGPQWDRHF